MKKLAMLTALLAALPAYGDRDRDDIIRTGLSGLEEVPVVNTAARGSFEARIDRNELGFSYKLSYSGLQGSVTQAHIHLGQKLANGGIMVWLCQTEGTLAPLAVRDLTPMCPPSPGGTVEGEVSGANVLAVATQQVAAGDIRAVIAAMRARLAYANVHSNPSLTGEIRGQTSVSHGHHHGHDRDD
jgi:CHRD domain